MGGKESSPSALTGEADEVFPLDGDSWMNAFPLSNGAEGLEGPIQSLTLERTSSSQPSPRLSLGCTLVTLVRPVIVATLLGLRLLEAFLVLNFLLSRRFFSLVEKSVSLIRERACNWSKEDGSVRADKALWINCCKSGGAFGGR